MSELRFDGRVVIVTGSTKGIGRACIDLFAQRGASVVVNGRKAEDVYRVVADIEQARVTALGCVADVARREDAERLASETMQRFGRIDVLVNNAGVLTFSPFAQMSNETFDSLMAINLGGAVNATRAVWPHMAAADYGRVIVTSSVSILGAVDSAHYTASKAALIGLMRTLALEGRETGIKVNAIMPVAHTAMLEDVMASGTDHSDEGNVIFELFRQHMSAGKVAPATAWLAHEACEVSGEAIAAGGGRVAKIFIGEGHGFIDRNLSIESVRDNWEAVCSEKNYDVYGDYLSSLFALMAELGVLPDQSRKE